ncbi:MAG: cupin domain-containing protein [Aliishimia sp.]
MINANMCAIQGQGDAMIGYKLGDEIDNLQHWPFDAPASAYQILSGTPRASGRIDAGGDGHTTRFGIWRCSTGAFKCTEQGDELMTILSGRCRVINHTSGQTCELAAGDSLFMRDGSRVTWEIFEEVTKVFHGYKKDGF